MEPISVFGTNTRKYGPGKTLYLDNFHAVDKICNRIDHIMNSEGNVLSENSESVIKQN